MGVSVVSPVVMSRRAVLSVAAVASAGVVLGGCGVFKKGGSASSGKGSGTASPRAALATATGPHGGIVLDAGWKGVPLSVEVGCWRRESRVSRFRWRWGRLW